MLHDLCTFCKLYFLCYILSFLLRCIDVEEIKKSWEMPAIYGNLVRINLNYDKQSIIDSNM